MSNLQETVHKVISTLFKILGLVPRKWALILGDCMGQIIFLADKKHREIALNNLAHAFGHKKKPHEIRLLAKQVFKNLVQVLFEIGWSLRLKREDFSKHFHIEGLSRLRTAYEKGKGVLLLTGHMGNWELLSIIGAMSGYPNSIVVRPLDFGPLEEFFRKFRTRFGTKLIATKHSMRTVLRSLEERHMVGLLMDQNVDWYEGVFVDFFGRLACTNKGLAILALKTGAPVVPLFLVRDQIGFKAEFGPELPLIQTGDKIKDVEANTEQYNQVIESFIRRYPDQWFWLHQRWKTRPYQPWPRRQ
jgi:KDO2-lipid IV(A) lauroyltransferase